MRVPPHALPGEADPAPTRLAARLLDRWAQVVARRPNAVLAATLLLALAGALSAVFGLRTDASRDTLVSGDREYHRRYQDYLDRFAHQEDALVIVDAQADAAQVARFFEKLAWALDREPLVLKQWYRTPRPERGALWWLSADDLRESADDLESGAAWMSLVRRWSDFPGLLGGIADELERTRRERQGDFEAPESLAQLALGIRDRLEYPEVEEQGALDAFFRAAGWNDDRPQAHTLLTLGEDPARFYLHRIRLKSDFTTLDATGAAVRAVRGHFERVRAAFPNLRCGLTGQPVLQHDEMATTNRDMALASIAALVLVTLLFLAAFRGWRRPAGAVLSVLVGLAWTAGVIPLYPGRLNLLSVVFAIILVSLGIDFSIHLIQRYSHELRLNRRPDQAMRQALMHTGPGVITGALTTSIAFLTTLATDFHGLAELGFIAGVGLILCLIASLSVLPAWILRREMPSAPGREPQPRFDRLMDSAAARFAENRPRLALALGLIGALVGAAWFARAHEFDFNLLDLQARGLESVAWEREILERTPRATMHSVVRCTSPEQARETARALRAQAQSPAYRDIIGAVETVDDFLPEDIEGKREAMARLRAIFTAIDVATESAPQDIAPMAASAERIGDFFYELAGVFSQRALTAPAVASSGAARDELSAFSKSELRAWSERLDACAASFESLGVVASRYAAGESRRRLADFEAAFFRRAREGLDELRVLASQPPPRLEDLPAMAREEFAQRAETVSEGAQPEWLVRLYPEQDLWRWDHLRRYIAAVERLAPGATGNIHHLHDASLDMKRGFEYAAVLSLLAVTLLLWWDFRSWRATLAALTPLLIGMGWTLGLMALFDLRFTMANFFAVPILLGIGIDDGVHMVHRFRESTDVPLVRRSTGLAVLLTSLTTMAGFGSIAAFAQHRGLVGLGLVLTLGVCACLLATLLVLPALLRLFQRAIAPSTPGASQEPA